MVEAESRWNAVQLKEQNVFPDCLIKSVWWSLREAKALLLHPQPSECVLLKTWARRKLERKPEPMISPFSANPLLVPRLCILRVISLTPGDIIRKF